jgi:23S rRNA (guanine745-N1)-methyltransferase
VLDEALDVLRCPHCGADLHRAEHTVRCAHGHAFDVARQGYLSLLPGDAQLGTADTAEMVAAREAFLAAGQFDPLADAIAEGAERALPAGTRGWLIDLGAGTGWYAARVLDRLPGLRGAALDLSKHALRRAARAHPRLAAVRCNAWDALPVKDDAAALALSVFAPRNGPELARVLRRDGALVVVTPTTRHLEELVDALGLLRVDERKRERLDERLAAHLVCEDEHELGWSLELDGASVEHAALMGPSAAHLDRAELRARIDALPDPTAVSAAVTVALYRRAD